MKRRKEEKKNYYVIISHLKGNQIVDIIKLHIYVISWNKQRMDLI